MLPSVLSASGVCIVIGKGALLEGTAGFIYEHLFKGLRRLVPPCQDGGHGFGHQDGAECILLAASQGKLAALRYVPGQQFHHLLRVGG